MIFEVNGVGVDDKKSLLHYKIWDVFMNEKGNLIKGGYLVEVFGSDGKKNLWKVIDDHAVEE